MHWNLNKFNNGNLCGYDCGSDFDSAEVFDLEFFNHESFDPELFNPESQAKGSQPKCSSQASRYDSYEATIFAAGSRSHEKLKYYLQCSFI